MSRLERCSCLILHLSQLPTRERNKLLRVIPKSYIDVLRDCCSGFLLDNVAPECKEQLRPYKGRLRAVANPNTDTTKARKHFQSGGFFQALIPVLARLVGPIIAGLVK